MDEMIEEKKERKRESECWRGEVSIKAYQE